jgi:hypothetical protein
MPRNVKPQMAWDHPNQTFKIMPLMIKLKKKEKKSCGFNSFQYIYSSYYTHNCTGKV